MHYCLENPPLLSERLSTRGKHAWAHEVQSSFFILLWYKWGKRKKRLFHFTQLGEHQIFPPGLCTELPDHLCKDVWDIIYLKMIQKHFFLGKIRLWETSIRPSDSCGQSMKALLATANLLLAQSEWINSAYRWSILKPAQGFL